MKILLTGANGYIGQRLLKELLEYDYIVYAVVRDIRRFQDTKLLEDYPSRLNLIEANFLNLETCNKIPKDIDVAYYLLHSMASYKDFYDLETICADNFVKIIDRTNARQVIYLSGISNDLNLSKHLSSRLNVENILRGSKVPLTSLRAAIIVGSGSASFEIMRDLVEKLPIMLAPKWLRVKCQPIAVRNVIEYLIGVLSNSDTYNQVYDIGGPEIMSYQEMLLKIAEVRKLKRIIYSVPFINPRISSYWLYLITSTTYPLARNLVDSLRNEVVCNYSRTDIRKLIPTNLLDFKEAVRRAFYMTLTNQIRSSWIDSLQGKKSKFSFDPKMVPQFGCLTDTQIYPFKKSEQEVLQNIWTIGGKRGWYYMDWAWQIRAWMDKLFGGVGMRSGRRDEFELQAGDALDFWRVLYANKEEKKLVLYAEMKLPGEAWLEFSIIKSDKKSNEYALFQRATFLPKGLWGRFYWYLVLPVHFFLFRGMAKNIVNKSVKERYSS